MAIFNVTNSERPNLPPTQVGDVQIDLDYNELYEFTSTILVTETDPVYSDPENDQPLDIRILTLPNIGLLTYDGLPVSAGQDIPYDSISLLNYQADPLELLGYSDDACTFNISDVGSESFGAITPGVITFKVSAQVNLPPSAVGDNSITIPWASYHSYTVNDFTDDTTPPYSDPELDPAENLRILSLPSDGLLIYNGIPCFVNQVVSFNDISLGLLSYVAENTILSAYSTTWDFAIADSGSGQFTS